MTRYDLIEYARDFGYFIVGALFVSAIVGAIYCAGRFGFPLTLDYDAIAAREIPYDDMSAVELHGIYFINGIFNGIVIGFIGLATFIGAVLLYCMGQAIVVNITTYVCRFQFYRRVRRFQRLRR